MSFNSFDKIDDEDIERAINIAEYQRSQGNLAKSYNVYCDILIRYLISHNSATRFRAIIMMVIHSLADLAIFFGDFEEAEDLLNGATRKYQEVQHFAMAYFTKLKRIDLAIERGENLAEKLLRELYPQIGDIETLDISPLGLINWEKDCFQEQTKIQERTVLFAYLYLAMGKLLSSLGQYGTALVILERGLFHTGETSPSIARQADIPMKFAIASACLEKGDLELAKEKLDILRTEINEVEQPEALVRWLEIYGKIHLLRGNLGQALHNFQQVKQICQYCCRDTTLPRSTLQATINLANILISLNQTSLAQQYLVEPLETAKILKDSKLVRQIGLLIELAKTRSSSLVEHPDTVSEMRGKRQNDANKKINQSEEDSFAISYSSNYLAKFEDRVLNFHLFLSRLDLVRANTLLSHIKEVFSLSDSNLIKIKVRILESALSYYRGVEQNDIEAIHWASLNFEEISSELYKLDLKQELWQTQRFSIWCLFRLKKHTSQNFLIKQEEIKAKREILIKQNKQLLNELSNSLSQEAQSIYLLNKWTSDEESIAADINLLQKLHNKIKKSFILLRPLRILTTKLYLHDFLEGIERYKDLVTQETIQTNKSSDNKAPSMSLFLRFITHPRDRITLFFLVLPDRILVVRIGWLLFDFRVIYTTRLQLRQLVQRWHQKVHSTNYKRNFTLEPASVNEINQDRDFGIDFDSVMGDFKNSSEEISQEIAEALDFSSLLNDLPQRIKAITIIPDDILHGFPFATIIHQNKYLIESYSLSIAYQTNNIKISPSIPSKPEKALVVGVSQPGNLGDRHFSALPGVESEIKLISNWLDRLHFSKDIFKNHFQQNKQEPAKQAVIDALSQATLVHIACHGVFEYNRPDQSGLVLVANSEAEVLSLKELSNLDLRKLRHATLSSCWSADHFVLPGRWIISVPETFWRSGTQSILGCLWQVSDKVAVPFMADFYENLQKYPRDKALQMTQLKCLQNKLSKLSNFQNIDTSSPFFWAGFNLYGDYTKLNL